MKLRKLKLQSNWETQKLNSGIELRTHKLKSLLHWNWNWGNWYYIEIEEISITFTSIPYYFSRTAKLRSDDLSENMFRLKKEYTISNGMEKNPTLSLFYY